MITSGSVSMGPPSAPVQGNCRCSPLSRLPARAGNGGAQRPQARQEGRDRPLPRPETRPRRDDAGCAWSGSRGSGWCSALSGARLEAGRQGARRRGEARRAGMDARARLTPLRADAGDANSFAAWRSGGILTTFQASPQRSSAQISQAARDRSRARRPWKAEEGKAWWLLCHDSPNESQESHQTLRDSSRHREASRPQ